MAEFQWWLLLVGLVAGGGLVAVVFLDGARREQDIEADELPAEAAWIAERLGAGEQGRLDPTEIEAVLREHREYRQLPPPDRLAPLEPTGAATIAPVIDPAVDPAAAAPAASRARRRQRETG